MVEGSWLTEHSSGSGFDSHSARYSRGTDPYLQLGELVSYDGSLAHVPL